MLWNESGTQFLQTCNVNEIVFQKDDIIYVVSQGSWQNNKYGYGGISLQAGTPIKATFKLNENVFKSQQGDLDTGASSSGTVTLAGVYSDNTEFSYDLLKA